MVLDTEAISAIGNEGSGETVQRQPCLGRGNNLQLGAKSRLSPLLGTFLEKQFKTSK
jgi:hypothetical protein